jgi:tetratricopeptide (TPR) repeat protein
MSESGERGRKILSSRYNKEVSKQIKEANLLVKQGDFNLAESKLLSIMQQTPNDAKCMVMLSDIYKLKKQMDMSIEYLHKAVSIEPGDSTVQELLFKALLDTGRYEEAENLCYKLMKVTPNNILARDVLGIIYLHQGKLDQAISVTDELIKIDPTDSTHHFKKAVLLQQKGELSKAMAGFMRALEIDPTGDMSNDAIEAIHCLDHLQINHILSIAGDDSVFRTKIQIDPERACKERGFCLSPNGVLMLKSLDLNNMKSSSNQTMYH